MKKSIYALLAIMFYHATATTAFCDEMVNIKATYVEIKSIGMDESTEGGEMKFYIDSQTKDSILAAVYYGETGKAAYKFIFNKKLIEAERIDYTYEVPIYADSKTKIRSIRKETLKTSKEARDRLTEAFAEHKRDMFPPAEFKDGKFGFEMVLVPGGTFKMGCTGEQSNCFDDEKPVRSVTVGNFYIGKYEVTQKQWTLVMGSNPSIFKGDDLPVENVSWQDVLEFLSKLNSMVGSPHRYRLPTEAQWEYAARGGARGSGHLYAGSNNIGDAGWHTGNSGKKTHPVGGKKANELGIYDMSGNVWEWVSDRFGAYDPSDLADPYGPSHGSSRVFRGGSWGNEASLCRTSTRRNLAPEMRNDRIGFRVVCTINE